jgi:acyl-CoA synthetase (NDP forming)
VSDGEYPGSLDVFFKPKSIAVIGASDDPTRPGGRVFSYLRQYFPRTAIPVNARREMVQGVRAVPRVGAAGEVPDLVVVAIPGAGVLEVLTECAQIGVKGAIVLSAGVDEDAPAVSALVAEYGMRVVGPNCVGVVDLREGSWATFQWWEAEPPPVGDVAVIARSGGVGMNLLWNLSARAGLGLSQAFATGNELDVTTGEVLEYLVERPDVRAVMLALESPGDSLRLVAAARRALELGKPVTAIIGGVGNAGTKAAVSHSGALAVPYRILRAALERNGVVIADSPTELVDFAAAFAGGRRAHGHRVAIMTGSGGLGVLAADAAEARGLAVPPSSASTERQLSTVVPLIGSVANPVDYTPEALKVEGGLEHILRTLLAADEFDAVCLAGVPPVIQDVLAEVGQSSDKPIVASDFYQHRIQALNEQGIPAYPDPVRAVRALAALWQFSQRRNELPAGETAPETRRPAAAPGLTGTLDATRTRQLLGRYGIPTVPESVVSTLDEAVWAARTFGYPVAMKAAPEVLSHKSEHGGVLLWLSGDDDVRRAFGQLRDLVAPPSAKGAAVGVGPRLLVQKMIAGRLELLLGAVRDPQFGPVVTVALGGVLVEVLNEAVQALCPVTEHTAMTMLRELCGGRLLAATRGLSPGTAQQVAACVVQLSNLMLAEAAVDEVDINPLIITAQDQLVAVDALVSARSPG